PQIRKNVLLRIRRAGVDFNPESGTEVNSFLDWEAAAQSLNMEAQRVEIRLQSDRPRNFRGSSKQTRCALSRLEHDARRESKADRSRYRENTFARDLWKR